MKNVFFKGVRINEDIVHIGNGKTIEAFADNFVDIRLKLSRTVGEAKRHDEIFEMAIARLECCFVFMPKGNTQSIEGVTNIDFREVFRPFHAI